MLRLDGIGKHYGERTVIRDLSLTVPAGTLTVVAGPNGAGKSTLLGIIAGLVRPDRGTVTLGCAPGDTGYLGHDTFLYPHLTALENLAFWQKLHKKSTDETALLDALEAMGLAALADEPAGTFSRGTAQRLSLARVFLQDPPLLLLDEPLSGLDAASGARVRDGLSRLLRKGSTLVWVSHSPLADARDAACALLLLPGGKHNVFYPDAFAALERALATGDAPC